MRCMLIRSRSKKAVMNICSSISLEIVTALCSFILPRLIITQFGSDYNGITSSISQFISCIALLKSGIGSVTRAALYKPLASNDYISISSILNATNRFMQKLALIFGGTIFGFAIIYPLVVKDEFNFIFTFTLVLILGVSTFFQYYFGLTYQMLLEADQKEYVIRGMQVITTILNTIIAVILINLNQSIQILKLGSALIFSIQPIILGLYVKRRYKIDHKISPNYSAISQRWDAFGHQVAIFIHSNTDIIILSLFTNMYEVSVYTVFYMIGNAVKKAINVINVGMSAAFGNMMAKEETDKLYRYFNLFEFIIISVSIIAFSCTLILYIPFTKLYTFGVTDINYIRPAVAYLITFAEFIMCVRIPYQTIVQSAGHFKQTRNGAYIEAAINIVVSIILTSFLGIVGVLIGTLCADLFRTIQLIIYNARHIIIRKLNIYIKRVISTTICFLVIVTASSFLPLEKISNYQSWFINAIFVFIIACTVTMGVNGLLYKSECLQALLYFKTFLKHTRGYGLRGRKTS